MTAAPPRLRATSALVAAGALALLTGCSAAGSPSAATAPASTAPNPEAVETPTEAPPVEADVEVGGGAVVEPAAEAVREVPVASPAVQAQLDYALAHWNAPNTAEYGYLDRTDCVNFASQTLIERGWSMDDRWWAAPGGGDWSSPWVSSTAFRDYLQTRPDLVSAVGDEARDQIEPGDIVQFDWDNSGDRDHTGIVTRVTVAADGATEVYFAGHTLDSDFRSVDDAITIDHPGGAVYYWAVA